jgi:hypothetical protein
MEGSQVGRQPAANRKNPASAGFFVAGIRLIRDKTGIFSRGPLQSDPMGQGDAWL